MPNSHLGLQSMTKEEQIDDLVEWILSSWDTSELESYARENLADYYNNPDNQDDFTENYEHMLDIRGE